MPKNEETALDKYTVSPFSDNALKLSKSVKQWCKDMSLARLFCCSTHTLQEDARSSCAKQKFPKDSYGSIMNSVT